MGIIYCIKNMITSDLYVGSTSNFPKRKSTHIRSLLKGNHHSIKLQRAVNKYGINNFVFLILETDIKIEELLVTENQYFYKLKPKYNIAASALAPMTGRKHTNETIEKLRKREVKVGKYNHNFGRKWTLEVRQKILSSRIGKKRTQEFKERQSKAALNNNLADCLLPYTEAQKVQVIDSLGNNFNSLVECASYHKISVATVCDILKGRHKQTRKKVSFRYKNT